MKAIMVGNTIINVERFISASVVDYCIEVFLKDYPESKSPYVLIRFKSDEQAKKELEKMLEKINQTP